MSRRHEPALRALPADQGLDADDTSRLELDLGLVVQQEFLLLERLTQLVLERELLVYPLGHLLLEEQIALAGALRVLQRRLGAAQQRFAVGAVFRKQGDADTRRRPELLTGDLEGCFVYLARNDL
jgi:hypothetical protein